MRYIFVWPLIWQWWKLSAAPLSVHTFSFPSILYTHTHVVCVCFCVFFAMEPIGALSLLFFLGGKKEKKAHVYYFSSNSDDEQNKLHRVRRCNLVIQSVGSKKKITVFLQTCGKCQVLSSQLQNLLREILKSHVKSCGGGGGGHRGHRCGGGQPVKECRVWTLSHNQSLCY